MSSATSADRSRLIILGLFVCVAVFCMCGTWHTIAATDTRITRIEAEMRARFAQDDQLFQEIFTELESVSARLVDYYDECMRNDTHIRNEFIDFWRAELPLNRKPNDYRKP